MGLERASFTFRKDTCLLAFREGQATHPILCGFGQWQRGETALPGTPPRLVSGGAPPRGTKAQVAAGATWTDQDTLALTLRYYETPHHDTVTCRFDGPKVNITFLNSIAGMNPAPKDPRPVLQGQMI